ncbi:MAG: PEP-CTERM sorting domain-containing protein [Verrucomicrobiota bacterium]
MKKLSFLPLAIASMMVFSVLHASAMTVSLDTDQYGGIFADGTLNNKPADQLYYVGYTIPTGSPSRAPERRNFFIFDFSTLSPGMGTIVAADMSLSLVTPGSIFYGDDDGVLGPGPKDMTEEFILSFDPSITPTTILSLDTDGSTNPGGPAGAGVDKATAESLFPGFGDPGMAVADPYMFFDGAPPGTPGTGTINSVTEPGEVIMPFNSVGLDVLNDAYAMGSTIILSGSMPSWSESLLMDGSGDFVESSEAIFFHTLLGVDTLDVPFLDLTFEIPEPSTVVLILFGAAGLLRRRRD